MFVSKIMLVKHDRVNAPVNNEPMLFIVNIETWLVVLIIIKGRFTQRLKQHFIFEHRVAGESITDFIMYLEFQPGAITFTLDQHNHKPYWL